jgi:hypothetical protein
MYTKNMDISEVRHSKSIGVGVILIGILLLTTFVPASWLGVKPKAHMRLDLDAINALSEINNLAQDNNNNNNPDWRDLLIDTFANSAGTSTIAKNLLTDDSVQRRLNDPNNLTASFSKNLYIASAYLEKNGITNEQIQREILDRLMAEEGSKLATTTYAYKDLYIAPKETKEAIKVYGNGVATILKDIITEKIITNDITSVNAFAQTKNEADLTPLVKNKNRVDALLLKLLNISVPPSAVSYHLLALNRIASYKDTLDNLSRANVDPVRATLAMKKYSDIAILVLRLNSQFSNYFDNGNIVFSPKDAGFIFTAGYTINN